MRSFFANIFHLNERWKLYAEHETMKIDPNSLPILKAYKNQLHCSVLMNNSLFTDNVHGTTERRNNETTKQRNNNSPKNSIYSLQLISFRLIFFRWNMAMELKKKDNKLKWNLINVNLTMRKVSIYKVYLDHFPNRIEQLIFRRALERSYIFVFISFLRENNFYQRNFYTVAWKAGELVLNIEFDSL